MTKRKPQMDYSITPTRGQITFFLIELDSIELFCTRSLSINRHVLSRQKTTFFHTFYFSDYHIVADGYGGKGCLIGREDEDRLSEIIKSAQRECREGKAMLLNVLIGKTDFREGSISV